MDTKPRARAGRARRRRLGQHFLTRRSAVQRVVQAIAPLAGQCFLEVGPGRGALTFPLLAAGARVVAVELDPGLAASLVARVAGAAPLKVVQGDILRVDLQRLAAESALPERGTRVVGNLPYSVASPAIVRLLRHGERFADFTLMVQREVAERILASPGSRLFGVLTLLCAVRAEGRPLLELSPGCFSPPPAVHSTLLHFTPRAAGGIPEAESPGFERVVKAAFSSRRKMLRNSLAAGLRISVDQAQETLRATGINPEDRPECVPLQGYLELARHLASFSPAPAAAKRGDSLV